MQNRREVIVKGHWKRDSLMAKLDPRPILRQINFRKAITEVKNVAAD
jgi:hypothetical protein